MINNFIFFTGLLLSISQFGCWEDGGVLHDGGNNTNACDGEAPLADMQDGVCTGMLKVCDATAMAWVEPDYSSLQGYEAEESTCDGLDNDCDGEVDEGGMLHYFPDLDGDGFGSMDATGVTACATPIGFVANNSDCDDDDGNNYPGNLEVCDGRDNNCDHIIDAGLCGDHSSCEDGGGTFDAICSCDSGYVESLVSPGVCIEAGQPVPGSLVITEIMLQPSNAATVKDGQYFEIFNTLDATVDLSDVVFIITDLTTDATFQTEKGWVLPPRTRAVISSNDSTTENGGVPVDISSSTWLELSIMGGAIELFRESDEILLDGVQWDATWNHRSGASLILSPAAPESAIGTLNDLGTHWCHSRFTAFGEGDFGTPGAGNDHCLVERCILVPPLVTTMDMHGESEVLYGQVLESGLTGSGTASSGQFITGQIGYGSWNSESDESWAWWDAAFGGGFSDPDYDQYEGILTLHEPGTFDFTYRFSMDGGLSHLYCDSSGTSGHSGSDFYDPADNGEMTVQEVAPTPNWAIKGGGVEMDEGRAMAMDSSGNILVAGHFRDVATFGTTTLTSSGENDIFITKVDPDGNYLWVVQAGGSDIDYLGGIAVDSLGNSYVTGYFIGTAYFGSISLTSMGADADLYVAKLDTNGNFLWAVRGGSSGSYLTSGLDIAVDGNGNLYVTGSFWETAQFGVHSITSSSFSDILILKMDNDGNFLWAKSAGGPSTDTGFSLGIDGGGNVLVTGRFRTSAQFDTISLVAQNDYDVFVAKLDPMGNYLWVVNAPGTSAESGAEIAVDSSGNGYLTGYFMGTVTFGPTQLTTAGSFDVFMAKIDPDGNFLWANQGGGIEADVGWGVAFDASGNSYFTGYYRNSAQFGSTNLVSNGDTDIYLAKLDPDGAFIWALGVGGLYGDVGYSVLVDNAGRSYVTGKFNDTVQFGTIPLTSAGGGEVFIAQFIP